MSKPNKEKFEEVKPKKAKKFTDEVYDFLWLQQRVLDKLTEHPELYRILDKLTYTQIRDRLIGKSGLEDVPVNLGGHMPLTVTPRLDKEFADLEKKFAMENGETLGDEDGGREQEANQEWQQGDLDPNEDFYDEGYHIARVMGAVPKPKKKRKTK